MSGTRTVLLVDDEQAFLDALADGLEYEGYRVFRERTVQGALELLAKTPVDLITIDMMMDPGESLRSSVDAQTAGLYLCREVIRRHRSVCVICISVVSDPDIIREVRRLGGSFIKKGETPLRTVLRRIIDSLGGGASW